MKSNRKFYLLILIALIYNIVQLRSGQNGKIQQPLTQTDRMDSVLTGKTVQMETCN